MTTVSHLQRYARRIRELRQANPDVPETALAPAFQELLDALIPTLPLAPRLTVVPEYHRPGVGRPDIALVRPGQPARAFVELKAPNKSADPTRWRGHDRAQFQRFKELASWAACNFAEIIHLERGEEYGSAVIVPAHTLRPDRDDAAADRAITAHDPGPFLHVIEILCAAAAQGPVARDAEHLAELLAHSARLVRGIVGDRLIELHGGSPDHPLLQVRREFRDVLYAHPEAGGYSARDFDVLFSAAFAQTLAFGLLLVREATGREVGEDAWRRMPAEHPLMRSALRVLSQPEIIDELGVGYEVLRDTVNSLDPALLVPAAGGRDPILYFYEDFLHTFDPDARERYGVYYTPVEVVRYMVGALDRVLRGLGTSGLRDPAVTLLDPATGTGTFLLGIAERVRAEAARSGAGMAALALQDLARRMFGFELLVGPYAVAHYRLHHTLRHPAHSSGPGTALPRLGVYLADTLSRPGAAAALGSLGFVAQDITEERREANRVKAEQPILAIIGNPPYRRLEEGERSTLVGEWMDDLWDDLKRPVRDAGEGGQLNTFHELSVAFWRWAIWKLFEAENAPQRGVVAFITNRKFLTGWPYAGLRQMMRERFDRIEIIDLRGDLRRGERAGVVADQGVFNILVGTAITLAIADGSKAQGELADVIYHDAWAEGHFSRIAKLGWLTAGAAAGSLPRGVKVERNLLDNMRPMPFLNGEWAALSDCFSFYRSGVQTKRDHFVYASDRGLLRARIAAFQGLNDDEAREVFASTAARPWNVARAQPVSEAFLRRVSYRPLDRRWLYNHPRFIDRPRPELQQVWGANNVGLYALPAGTGAGPAVWCHGLLPDYHALRGSYGGYAFPLHDRRPEVAAPNISAWLVTALSAAYGEPVAPEAVFDAILCLLSASSYTQLFAEDLEDAFPHIPFPARPDMFAEAARIGAEIRAVETFARPPAEAYRSPDFVRLESEPTGVLAEAIDYADGAISLCADGSGEITGLPRTVWAFRVSKYRVLPRWLEARAGLNVNLALVEELRDLCGRIAELNDLFTQADHVLEATLAEALTRAALGLEQGGRDADDGRRGPLQA